MDKVKTICDYSVDEIYNQFCIINEVAKSIENGTESDKIYEGIDKVILFFYGFITIIDYTFDIRNINKEQVKEYLDLYIKVDKLSEIDRIKIIAEFIINRNVIQLEKIKEESDMKFKNGLTNFNIGKDKYILTFEEGWNNNPF